ncbi:MAG: hypothetical protein ACSHYA_19520 [Opitutaceae bacterium]
MQIFNKSDYAKNLPDGNVYVVDAAPGQSSGCQAKSLGGVGHIQIDKDQELTVTAIDDQSNAGQANTTLDTVLAHEVTHEVHENFVGETDYATSGEKSSVSLEDSARYPNHKEKIAIEGGVLTNGNLERVSPRFLDFSRFTDQCDQGQQASIVRQPPRGHPLSHPFAICALSRSVASRLFNF